VHVTYELVAPDGTRVVFGDSEEAKVDPDYVGPPIDAPSH
jgi:hypothetical protein